jgi:hypothetical protein
VLRGEQQQFFGKLVVSGFEARLPNPGGGHIIKIGNAALLPQTIVNFRLASMNAPNANRALPRGRKERRLCPSAGAAE